MEKNDASVSNENTVEFYSCPNCGGFSFKLRLSPEPTEVVCAECTKEIRAQMAIETAE